MGPVLEESLSSFGSLVRSYRRAAGLTQRELAVRAGLSLAAVRDLEQGRRCRPRLGSLRALGAALGLSAGQTGVLERAARPGRPDAQGPGPGAGDAVLWVSVLGPLEVWRGGEAVQLGSPTRQVIAGLLAVAPGMVVQREELVDVLWGQRPPRTAAELVQAHASRLRRALGPGGDGELVVASCGGCYRLLAGWQEVDLTVFRVLTGRAAAATEAGDVGAACELYGRAVALWRGDPCGDVGRLRDHPAVTGVRRELAEAVLGWAAVAGQLGRHDLVLGRLWSLAATEPLNERVHARLMAALAGCGQQAAACRVFEELRLRLDRELGLYPGEELTEAHLRLLQGTRSTQQTPAPGQGYRRQHGAPVGLDTVARLMPYQTDIADIEADPWLEPSGSR